MSGEMMKVSEQPPAPYASWLDWAIHWDTRSYSGIPGPRWTAARDELAALRAERDALLAVALAAAKVRDAAGRLDEALAAARAAAKRREVDRG
jgi:hypothetical protein